MTHRGAIGPRPPDRWVPLDTPSSRPTDQLQGTKPVRPRVRPTTEDTTQIIAASYRVLVADPMYHQLTVAITMPPTVELRVWLETTLGRRVPVVDTEDGLGRCWPGNRQFRCRVTLDALHEEKPGVWAVGLAKRSTQPAAIRVTVTF